MNYSKILGLYAEGINYMKNEWNKTSYPAPYELVEILMKDGKIHTDMMVRAKYGNLTWRNWDDKAVIGWRKLN